MAYRLLEARIQVADDSNLDQLLFDRRIVSYQTKDLKVVTKNVRVAASDADTAIDLTPISQGYFYAIYADYPVRFRINGVGATQQTLVTSGVAATNLGGPMPDQCFACANALVTSIYLQPIAGATQTANVRIVVMGDPTNAYT